MNTHVSPRRGKELLRADRAYRSGGAMARLIALAPASLFHRMLDRIDAGLAQGTIESHLPDGSVRLLGGRGKGAVGARVVTHRDALDAARRAAAWRGRTGLAVGRSRRGHAGAAPAPGRAPGCRGRRWSSAA